ncbi:MAG: LysR family transcriptional regulator, partial [Zymomonas sp.]
MATHGLMEFDAVFAMARQGSFRAAALELGLSTTALSNLIGKLERRLRHEDRRGGRDGGEEVRKYHASDALTRRCKQLERRGIERPRRSGSLREPDLQSALRLQSCVERAEQQREDHEDVCHVADRRRRMRLRLTDDCGLHLRMLRRLREEVLQRPREFLGKAVHAVDHVLAGGREQEVAERLQRRGDGEDHPLRVAERLLPAPQALPLPIYRLALDVARDAGDAGIDARILPSHVLREPLKPAADIADLL